MSIPNNTTCPLLQLSFNASCFYSDTKNHSFGLYEVLLAVLVAIAILSPVAVVGNALVLAAIWRNPSLRTPSYILLAVLAISDFCTGIIAEPFSAANELIFLADPLINPFDKNSWPTFYLITRAIGDGCFEYFFYMTLLVITLMSIERWLHMSRRSLVTLRRLYRIIAGLFLLPLPLAVYRVEGTHSKIYFFVNLVVVLFCLIVTSVAYFKVFRIIRRHQQQIQANNTSHNSAQPTIDLEKYKKSVFSILYILLIFYIGYLPMAIGLWMLLFAKEISKILVVSLYVSNVLVFLSSSLNPLLCLWRMKDIRNEVRKLVKPILCKDN